MKPRLHPQGNGSPIRKLTHIMKLNGLLLFCLFGYSAPSFAQQTYYHVPVGSLTISEGTLPIDFQWNRFGWEMVEVLQPFAVLDGPGEAFVNGDAVQQWGARESYQNLILALRAPKGSAVTGRLFLPNKDLNGMVALKFKVDASTEKPDSKIEFLKARENYYRR